MSVYSDQPPSSQPCGALSQRAAIIKASGVTLIELLIVLAILAILLLVATPNYDSIISGSKVDEARLAMATSLALARTEAIERGETISVCPTVGCDGGDWNQGWMVGIQDGEVIQVVEYDGNDATIVFPCGFVLAYSSTGLRQSPNAGAGSCTFTFSRNTISKTLVINPSGRVRMN